MHLNRRRFLATSLAAMAGGVARLTAAAQPLRITVDAGRMLGVLAPDFTGFGYEISSVPLPGLLSAQNRMYVQLLRNLGTTGVIRIGGNTSDYSTFEPAGKAVSAPKQTVVDASSIRQLGTFLQATGWKLIWGLNLGTGSEQQAVEEAQAIAATAQDKLLAFEIGNEPDIFGRAGGHRPKAYNYDEYLQEYRRYKTAIRAKLPNAPFAGPDVASATNWIVRFAADEGNDLKLLTHHYYRECANPGSTLDKLLHTDPKLMPELETLRHQSQASKVPYRICETNSFCGGGRPGVSDTFGAALWVLDFMFTLAVGGCAGVNIETGVNQLGFISSYSPVGDDEHGIYSAKPEYYGMLAFAQAGHGQLAAVDIADAGPNLSAYAVKHEQKGLSVTIVNKDAVRNVDASITAAGYLSPVRVLRLSGPALDSKDGVTLGGASVNANGEWTPSQVEHLHNHAGEYKIDIPAASASVLTWAS